MIEISVESVQIRESSMLNKDDNTMTSHDLSEKMLELINECDEDATDEKLSIINHYLITTYEAGLKSAVLYDCSKCEDSKTCEQAYTDETCYLK